MITSLCMQTFASLTCGQVKGLYTDSQCCPSVNSQGASKPISPTCTYDSPLQQMREFVGDWGQCVDAGMVWQTQNWQKSGSYLATPLTQRPPYSTVFPYVNLTRTRLNVFCKGIAKNARVKIQNTAPTEITFLDFGYQDLVNFPNGGALSDEVDRLYSSNISNSYVLPVISAVLAPLSGGKQLTQADLGIDTAYDNPGTKFTLWYAAMWVAFGYSSISHMFVPFGAEYVPGGIANDVDATDATMYDGVIEGRGYCLHFKADVAKGGASRIGPFGGGELYQDNVFLNYKFFFTLIDGQMRVTRYYHIKYMEERVPLPPLLP